jgi:hypothetical protein
MDGKFIPCAKMFLLTLGRDPIEGLFFTKDLKIKFGPPADLAAAHKWWCLSDRHHNIYPRLYHEFVFVPCSLNGVYLCQGHCRIRVSLSTMFRNW